MYGELDIIFNNATFIVINYVNIMRMDTIKENKIRQYSKNNQSS
jgi:uncharacterized membrane protein